MYYLTKQRQHYSNTFFVSICFRSINIAISPPFIFSFFNQPCFIQRFATLIVKTITFFTSADVDWALGQVFQENKAFSSVN